MMGGSEREKFGEREFRLLKNQSFGSTETDEETDEFLDDEAPLTASDEAELDAAINRHPSSGNRHTDE